MDLTYNSLIDNSPNDSTSRLCSRSSSLSSIEFWPFISLSKKSRQESFCRDQAVIERLNLVNLSKLIVRELIDISVKNGGILEYNQPVLQHFFIMMEHVLRHRLRCRKGILGTKKDLWDILQRVEKHDNEAQEMSQSIRDLPTVRTEMGRARAWLRIALMRKKLADYLKILVDNRETTLSEYFEPDALMMNDDIMIVVGSLIGLSVIDFNLCIKEESLDHIQEVIDFSNYFRSNYQNNDAVQTPNNDVEYENINTVLDQKNYVEELNRHLRATITDLQSKVDQLTTLNTHMKEDLEICRTNVRDLQHENAVLRIQYNENEHTKLIKKKFRVPKEEKAHEFFGEEVIDVNQLNDQMINERKLRLEAERELNNQVCSKAEIEVAMKLLEKDIHEKQDTIISLRKQLEDIKMINLEMYKKLQECENSLKHKKEVIAQFESKTTTMAEALEKMDKKNGELEKEKINTVEALYREKEQLKINSEMTGSLDNKFKTEKKKKESLEKSLQEERDKINKIKEENAQLKIIAGKYVELQEENHKLLDQCAEQEKTLEELGAQFGMSKLHVEELKEKVSQKSSTNEIQWASDKEVTHCRCCGKEFNMTRRKHHCRNCGNIFCSKCSDNSIALPGTNKSVRVCDDCYHLLLQEYTVIVP